LLGTSAAQAQLIKAGEYPPPKDGFVTPQTIRPIETPGLLHGWVATVGYQYGRLESKVSEHPETRDINTVTAGLNFRVGMWGFGGVDLSSSNQQIDSRNDPSNGAIAIDGDVSDVGIRATGGYLVLPFLAVGGSIARNSTGGSYQFAIPVPANDTDGNTMSYSAFTTLIYPVDDWKFSLTGAYAYGEATQAYTNNVPADQKGWTRTASAVLTASHPITARLDGKAGLAINHIIEQSSFGADRGMDDNWLMPSLGLVYKVTDQASLNLTASTFLMNSVSDYDAVSLSLSYKF
jgi:hypothetical protein